MRKLEPKSRAIVENLADKIPSDEPFDMVALFSIRLPFDKICMILGLPASDWKYLHHYREEFVTLIDPSYPVERAVEAAKVVSEDYTYLAEHIKAARKNSHSELIQ